SSRRRLTRSYGDWSSDVCSSDLKVVATDISPEMLAYGRERAAAAGLENVEFVESEAASLDFPAESFDAALSRFGIIFEPEAEARSEERRVGKECGGRGASPD